jgi:hypothetical protein
MKFLRGLRIMGMPAMPDLRKDALWLTITFASILAMLALIAVSNLRGLETWQGVNKERIRK